MMGLKGTPGLYILREPLAHRASDIYDLDRLPGDTEFLRSTLKQNDCNSRPVLRALSPLERKLHQDDPTSVVFLPFVGQTLNRIGRMISTFDVKTVGLSPGMVTSFLRLVKDDLDLSPGVYNFPCECDVVYIGQTGHSIGSTVGTSNFIIRRKWP
jgi:hypothetical protein